MRKDKTADGTATTRAGNATSVDEQIARVIGPDHVSDRLSVFFVEEDQPHVIGGQEYRVAAGFQPSVLLDHEGTIHVFFQARLDTSEDDTEKMIGHVTSRDGGATFSGLSFVNPLPMQTYAISAFLRELPSGGKRVSLLTSLSIDETVSRLKDPDLIRERLGIDVNSFSRKAACLVLEFYSDDAGRTWARQEHPDICDRVYPRNGRDFYLAFINLIGQVRRAEVGPFAGRLFLGGHVIGDYLPCLDHPRFREYRHSSSVLTSDDDGASWQFGGVVSDGNVFGHSEASAAAVDGGRRVLLVRRRRGSVEGDKKLMHYSDDGGATWGPGTESGIDAVNCLQALEKCGDIVLCSAPGEHQRTHGRIYMSRDHGFTWTHKLIDEGPFSYSTVNRLTGDYFMCCFSQGVHGEQGLAARFFWAKWLDAE